MPLKLLRCKLQWKVIPSNWTQSECSGLSADTVSCYPLTFVNDLTPYSAPPLVPSLLGHYERRNKETYI